ncbi:UDP-N-acetylmuramoyl-tripeptide--D-alanyl-D-alanine ligase [Vitreimonas flagellata]|uniref:UDP-N-acetylmuramoyl-tripeptide--D-alanyl-D- alanine ligase n=1 Tax=Vitreimonas flagellata TaxID=2560861 RepID=UPI001074D6BF|nr:UDP-N-acetylmuramoyl-tripeptide--D-alanyl-D-alanine ligase [Vitreimonas flagellata]
MSELWTAQEAARATGGRLINGDQWSAGGVSIDTRTLEPGDLFVALKDVRDGHDFLAQAYVSGAGAALISDASKAEGMGPALVVPDVLDGLRKLGEAARERSTAKRVAVTGSVGKTSTKEALAVCLSASGQTHRSVKSYNNHWGVPLTLSRMPAESRFAVFEIGMNHRGEILPLTHIVRPHAALVTTIAPAHVENLGSLEAIADEKGDIYAGLEPGGAALVPNEAPHASRLIEAAERNGANLIRFGRDSVCEARLLKFDMDDTGSTAEAEILGRLIRYRVGVEGAHWALNSLAALAAADVIGADLDAAAHALEHLRAFDGRGVATRVEAPFGGFLLVDDSYNANPASMAAAFSTLGARKPAGSGRRIAVLGDMLELGPEERAYHSGLATPLQEAGVDLVFAAGPRMAALMEALPPNLRGGYAETADALIPVIAGSLQAGDIVLVKGSNGSKMSRVVAALSRLGGDN